AGRLGAERPLGKPPAARLEPMVGKAPRVACHFVAVFAHDCQDQRVDDLALADIRGSGAVETDLARRWIEMARAFELQPVRNIRRGALPASAVQHIGAAPDFAAHEPTLAGKRVGPAHRADRHADVEGEVALRRQLGALGQHAALDVLFDLLGKPQIERPGAAGEVGKPICHRDNFLYCHLKRVNAYKSKGGLPYLYRLAAANMTKTMDTIDTISRQPRSSSSHE